MRLAFAECIQGYRARHKNFFTADGKPYRGNSIAGMFWRGVDGQQIGVWDAASKKTFSYAHWKAGQAIARERGAAPSP